MPIKDHPLKADIADWLDMRAKHAPIAAKLPTEAATATFVMDLHWGANTAGCRDEFFSETDFRAFGRHEARQLGVRIES